MHILQIPLMTVCSWLQLRSSQRPRDFPHILHLRATVPLPQLRTPAINGRSLSLTMPAGRRRGAGRGAGQGADKGANATPGDRRSTTTVSSHLSVSTPPYKQPAPRRLSTHLRTLHAHSSSAAAHTPPPVLPPSRGVHPVQQMRRSRHC